MNIHFGTLTPEVRSDIEASKGDRITLVNPYATWQVIFVDLGCAYILLQTAIICAVKDDDGAWAIEELWAKSEAEVPELDNWFVQVLLNQLLDTVRTADRNNYAKHSSPVSTIRPDLYSKHLVTRDITGIQLDIDHDETNGDGEHLWHKYTYRIRNGSVTDLSCPIQVSGISSTGPNTMPASRVLDSFILGDLLMAFVNTLG